MHLLVCFVIILVAVLVSFQGAKSQGASLAKSTTLLNGSQGLNIFVFQTSEIVSLFSLGFLVTIVSCDFFLVLISTPILTY